MSANANTTKHKKKRMLKALHETLSIVTPALEMAGVDRKTYYTWLKKDPKFKEAVDSVEDVALDVSETQLMKNVKEGKEASVFFHLKCRGKKRGYIERQERDINAEVTLKVIYDND